MAGQRILVTGGGTGLGRGMAERFLELSADVAIRGRRKATRRGVLVEEEGSTYMANNDGDSDEARMLRPLQAAVWPCRPRLASGQAPRQVCRPKFDPGVQPALPLS